MAWWNYPTNYSGTEVSGVSDFFFNFPQHLLGGKFAIGITVMIWVMSFALSMQAGSRKAFMVASFITLIFAIWVLVMVGGAMNIGIVFLLLTFVILGAVLGKDEAGGL